MRRRLGDDRGRASGAGVTGREANLAPPGLAGILRADVRGADRLMTIGELAEYLQVPRETIYRWRKRGGGPCGFRMGRHVRFRRSDVEAWLEARRDPAPFPARSDLRFRR